MALFTVVAALPLTPGARIVYGDALLSAKSLFLLTLVYFLGFSDQPLRGFLTSTTVPCAFFFFFFSKKLFFLGFFFRPQKRFFQVQKIFFGLQKPFFWFFFEPVFQKRPFWLRHSRSQKSCFPKNGGTGAASLGGLFRRLEKVRGRLPRSCGACAGACARVPRALTRPSQPTRGCSSGRSRRRRRLWPGVPAVLGGRLSS